MNNSFKPHLFSAFLNWMSSCGVTPMVSAVITDECMVPNHPAFIMNEITWLNISANAIRDFLVDDKGVSFQARFGMKAENIYLPWESIVAIRAQEWPMVYQLPDVQPPVGGMDELPSEQSGRDSLSDRGEKKQAKLTIIKNESTSDTDENPTPPPKGKPGLRIVK